MGFVLGRKCLDSRLTSIVKFIKDDIYLVSNYSKIAQKIISHWQLLAQQKLVYPIQLVGKNENDSLAVAYLVNKHYQANLCRLDLLNLSASINHLTLYKCLLIRQAQACRIIYFVNCDLFADLAELKSSYSPLKTLLEDLLVAIPNNIILYAKSPSYNLTATLQFFEVQNLTPAEQLYLWRYLVNPSAVEVDNGLLNISQHFNYSAQQIAQVAKLTSANCSKQTMPEKNVQELWQTCKTQVKQDIAGLAYFIESKVKLTDIILSEQQHNMLEKIIERFNHRHQVYSKLQLAPESEQILNMLVLLAGPSGTGKTLTAKAIANQLNLNLLCVDLATIISPYAKETEKNINKVFSLAESAGAILLFEEISSLLNSESMLIKTNLYATQGINYWLQRMRSYKGMILLTATEQKTLDKPFLNSCQFIVQFDIPNDSQRTKIWQNILQSQTTEIY